MSEKWYCVNCDLVTRLDVHGKCDFCGSDVVVSTERIGWKPPKRVSRKAREVKELERMMQ